MTTLDQAIDYASRGWPVVPLWWPLTADRCACGRADCASIGKHPHGRLTPQGLSQATTDLEQIRAWWGEIPDLNVGLTTGQAFDVLDLDRPEAGSWLGDYAYHLGATIPDCWAWGPMSITGKGSHLLYQPTGARNRAQVNDVPGFDWRGAGGYIVAPPSRHASGNHYHWHPDCGPDAPIPPAPSFLAELVIDKSPPPPLPPAAPSRFGVQSMLEHTGGRWNPAGIIGTLATATVGDRNHTLVWAAHKIGLDVREGKADRTAGDDACLKLHSVALNIGLTESETIATIRSGYSAGLAGKRRAPV